jgi:hypothetical protein
LKPCPARNPRNSGDAWDLRCLVRGKLIEFLQKSYPGSLPRVRGEFAANAAVELRGRATPEMGRPHADELPAQSNDLRKTAQVREKMIALRDTNEWLLKIAHRC